MDWTVDEMFACAWAAREEGKEMLPQIGQS